MQKIIGVFQRNHGGDNLIRNEVTPGAEWVLAGEGLATRKFDGTCCMLRDGKLFKRYDAKRGKTPPPGFEPAQEPDPVTGHHPGWVPVGDGPEDKWHREAWENECVVPPDGTYELCGPKIQGNPERRFVESLVRDKHVLIPHGRCLILHCPRDFEGIRELMSGMDIEGIVFHHPDGRMAKVKIKDFGLPRILASGV